MIASENPSDDGDRSEPTVQRQEYPPDDVAFTEVYRSAERDTSRAAGNTGAAPETDGIASQQEPAADDALPDQLGRFLIQRRLGCGTFGVVYLAHDPQLDRSVALKVPRREQFATDGDLRAFLAEARTAAHLKHPGLVAVYDVTDVAGAPVIVQEYIDGVNLGDWLRSNAPSFRQVAEVMVELSEAIGHAHREQFVHRDLKPANILMDAEGHPHVADFGLAIHESGQRQQRGLRAGSPAYMSPELVRGDTHLLDGRSDIWSLGVIFYELLAGRRPFAGASLNELFEEITSRDPKPVRQVRPDAPRELEDICLRCLAKPITARYPTTADVADDLRNWLSQQSAPHLLAGGRGMSVASRTAVWLGGAFVVTTLLLGIAYLTRPAPLDKSVDDLSHLVSQVCSTPHHEAADLIATLATERPHLRHDIVNVFESLTGPETFRAKARLAIIALHWQQLAPAAAMCQLDADHSDRSIFIDEAARWHGDLNTLAEVLSSVDDSALRPAICLAIGSVSPDEIAVDARQRWRELLERWYLTVVDAGSHSASGWALRQWKLPLPEVPVTVPSESGHEWAHTEAGLVLVRVPAGSFQRQDDGDSTRVIQTVHVSEFWMSDREVTTELFWRFLSDDGYPGERPLRRERTDEHLGPVAQKPMAFVTWYEAVMFCNWLSHREGRPACYERTGEQEQIPDQNRKLKSFDAWRLLPQATGYRLPTEAEWEYACRAGTTSEYFCGDNDSFLPAYAVFGGLQPAAVAQTLCNPWGLFDMTGNVNEWCQDILSAYGDEREVVDPMTDRGGTLRVLRGGASGTAAPSCRSGYRLGAVPFRRGGGLGFRVVLASR